MSGSDFLEVLLMLVLWHIPLAVTCLHVYEQQQRLTPGSRIQFSLVDLFFFTLAAAVTISLWSYFTIKPYYEPSVGSIIVLIFFLLHQLAGVLIMRLQPRTTWDNHPFLGSFVDILVGSLIGLFAMTIVSAIGATTFISWFPIWLFFRFRNWREKKASAREELGT